MQRLVPVTPFFIPLNIYIIGDLDGGGNPVDALSIPAAYLGANLIRITRDLDYVATGILSPEGAGSP